MTQQPQPPTLEHRILAELAARSGIEFGELHLSVWDGHLVEVSDRVSRRAGEDVATKLKPVDELRADDGFQKAVEVLADMYQSSRFVVVLKLQNGSVTWAWVQRVGEATDDETERRRQQLRAGMAGFR